MAPTVGPLPAAMLETAASSRKPKVPHVEWLLYLSSSHTVQAMEFADGLDDAMGVTSPLDETVTVRPCTVPRSAERLSSEKDATEYADTQVPPTVPPCRMSS